MCYTIKNESLNSHTKSLSYLRYAICDCGHWEYPFDIVITFSYKDLFRVLRVLLAAKSLMISSTFNDSKISDSMLITDRQFNRSCTMRLRSSFLINLSFEKERSPVQFVSIMHRNILIAISTFGNVDYRLSFFIIAYNPDIDGRPTGVFAAANDI